MRAVIQRVRRARVTVHGSPSTSVAPAEYAAERLMVGSGATPGATPGATAGATTGATTGTPTGAPAGTPTNRAIDMSVAGPAITEVATGAIAAGIVVFVGVSKDDTPEAAAYVAGKTAQLRIFEDAQGKMNLSLLETGYSALVISQFTLYGDVRHGRRPGFDRAAPAAEAEPLYQQFILCLRTLGVRVETGVFQAHMEVELVNDGPVTILIDSEKKF
jgi:D-tyrosyl-tRNA(Tyr) deacylase